jgi:hypothetical protein
MVLILVVVVVVVAVVVVVVVVVVVIVVVVVVGTAVAQWLRCCATNRKVAGSIQDGVTGIQPLTN